MLLAEICPDEREECIKRVKEACPDLNELCLRGLSQMDYYLVGRENFPEPKGKTDKTN